MKNSNIINISILLIIIAPIIAFAEARPWKISHVRQQGTAIDNDLKWFSETLKKSSDGELKTKIYAASALGDYTVVQERVGLGSFEMACQPPASTVDRRFQMVYFPYLVKNWDQAKKNYSPGAPIREIVAELYSKQGIQLLAAWPVYFGGLSLNREPVSPGDPNAAKGIKLRVPPMKTFQLLADKTGYIGSPIPFSDTFTAVQTGVVDGVIGSGAEGYYSSFRDVTKYYIPLNTHFEVWYLFINKETYENLKLEHKKILDDVAKEFESRRWETAEADQEANEKRLVDYGAKIVDISDEEIAATAKKVEAQIWPIVLEDVGAEWGQNVIDSIVE